MMFIECNRNFRALAAVLSKRWFNDGTWTDKPFVYNIIIRIDCWVKKEYIETRRRTEEWEKYVHIRPMCHITALTIMKIHWNAV